MSTNNDCPVPIWPDYDRPTIPDRLPDSTIPSGVTGATANGCAPDSLSPKAAYNTQIITAGKWVRVSDYMGGAAHLQNVPHSILGQVDCDKPMFLDGSAERPVTLNLQETMALADSIVAWFRDTKILAGIPLETLAQMLAAAAPSSFAAAVRQYLNIAEAARCEAEEGITACDMLLGFREIDECGTKSYTLRKASLSTIFPVGTVLPYGADYSEDLPPQWLPCDGGIYSVDSYPELFAAIGFNFGGGGGSFRVPDLRAGVFMRFGDSPEQDDRFAAHAGGATTGLGSYQCDAFQGHTHDLSNDIGGFKNVSISVQKTITSNSPGSASKASVVKDVTTTETDVTATVTIGAARELLHGPARIAVETRPFNVQMNAIIYAGCHACGEGGWNENENPLESPCPTEGTGTPDDPAVITPLCVSGFIAPGDGSYVSPNGNYTYDGVNERWNGPAPYAIKEVGNYYEIYDTVTASVIGRRAKSAGYMGNYTVIAPFSGTPLVGAGACAGSSNPDLYVEAAADRPGVVGTYLYESVSGIWYQIGGSYLIKPYGGGYGLYDTSGGVSLVATQPITFYGNFTDVTPYNDDIVVQIQGT